MKQERHKEETLAAIGLALIASAIFIVYRPGLTGPFVFDDYQNIVDNSAVAIDSLDYPSLMQAAGAGGSGPLMRPLASLTFAFNHYLSGNFDSAYGFKLTNLGIHIINTILVFWLARLLIGQLSPIRRLGRPAVRTTGIALVTCAIWGLHPINVNAVLYVVQRMASLASLFMLLGMICFAYGRQRFRDSRRFGLSLMTAGLLGGMLIGALSKEIALLLPLYLLVIDIAFFRGRELQWPRPVLVFHATSIGTLLVGAAVFASFLNLLEAYQWRDFTLAERLLTETRVGWAYVSLLIHPVPSRFSLFHDYMPLSTGLFTPWTTLAALAGLVAAALIAFAKRKTNPFLFFAVAWFLAGHAMESTVIGLEIMHEHRNYLPSAGMFLALAYQAKTGLERWCRPALRGFLAVLALSAVALSTHVRAHVWTTDESLIDQMIRDHPKSARAHSMLAELRLTRYNDPLRAILHLHHAALLSPGDPALYLRTAIASTHPMLADETERLVARARIGRWEDRHVLDTLFEIILPNRQQGILQPRFAETVSDVLERRPLTPDGRQVLARFGRCIVEAPNTCAPLAAHAMHWYSAILRNTTADPAMRRQVVLMLFDIGVLRKDYTAALHAADLGGAQEPDNPTYTLMRANALILLRRYLEAEKLVDEVAAMHAHNQELQGNVATLRSMLQKRR